MLVEDDEVGDLRDIEQRLGVGAAADLADAQQLRAPRPEPMALRLDDSHGTVVAQAQPAPLVNRLDDRLVHGIRSLAQVAIDSPGPHPTMSVQLDHTIVFARDRTAAAALIAAILDVPWAESRIGPFTAVYVNDGLTFDVDQLEGDVPVQHFCFRVDDAAFDGIVARLAARDIAVRSTPHGPVDGKVNTAHGGRIVYWSEPDGHVWEALTVSYARR